MEENIKNKYISLIDSLESDLEMLETIRDFIIKYDGPDSYELNKLLMDAIEMCIDIDRLESKANAYDYLNEMKQEQKEEIQKVMEEDVAENGISIEDIIVPVSDSTKEENNNASQ